MQRFDDDIDGTDFDDGSSSRYDDERDEMLRIFGEQLCDDPRTIRYDEEEWIMLADYADDVDNVYLFSEAVIRGLQSYPDSAELADRHLLLLNRFCRSEELRNAFDAASSRPGASKIARLYDYFYHWTNPVEGDDSKSLFVRYGEIRMIMLDGELLTDQEAIEAVRVIGEMGLLKLAAEDMDSWIRMTDFPETFRYELAATAFEHYDTEISLRLADILVEEYPYNFRYWILKSRIELTQATHTGDEDEAARCYDDAINSVDTALAINPDNSEASLLREHIDIVRNSRAGKVGSGTTSIMVDTDGNPIGMDSFLDSTPVERIISNMSVEMLICLFDSNNERARAVIVEWIKREFEGYSNLDGIVAPRIYAFTVALYTLDRVDDVDFILETSKQMCLRHTDYDEYLLIDLIRHIEKSRLDDADRLMTIVERVYGEDDASVAVLRAVLDRGCGRHARSDSAYDTYRHIIVNHLVKSTVPVSKRTEYDDLELFATENHDPSGIDVVVAHFLTRCVLAKL